MRCRSVRAACVALLIATCVMAPIARGETIRVRQATFDAFIDELQPFPFSGRYVFRVTIDTIIFGRHTITLCNSAYAGTVHDLRFLILPNVVQVLGQANFNWCGLGFGGVVNATGTVSYSNGAVRTTFTSASVRPSFNLLGNTVRLPFTINIAPTLNIPPLPIGPALIGFETANGTRYLRMQPENVQVNEQAGFIELTSDVRFR